MSELPAKTNPDKRKGLRKNKRENPDQDNTPRWNKECLCGQKLNGLRVESPQRILCDHCDRKHFILPVSKYPEPKRLKKKRAKKRQREEPLSKTISRKLSRAGIVLKAGIGKLLAIAWQKTLIGFHAFLASLTPLRLTLLSLVIVICGGIYFAIQQQQQSQAVRVLRDSVAEAESAMKEQNWPVATEQFHLAAEAIRVLNRDDVFAREVLQKDRELQAVDGLCLLSLEEIIEEVSDPQQTLNDWETLFRLQIDQRWIIVETWLAPGKSDTVIVETIPLKRGGISLIWPATLMKNHSVESGPVHVLIAGQISAVEKSAVEGIDWEIRIQPETAFQWCFSETCERLNFELETPWMPEDSLRSVLERQKAELLKD
ncbi:hypothetical protein [uncultured Rubinisphaera sp.]|uniref:hypothetical protein n=1 Tax=uncultured Rubinisphaera sp. TaxID=1678686 RepID=UPI0030DBDC5D